MRQWSRGLTVAIAGSLTACAPFLPQPPVPVEDREAPAPPPRVEVPAELERIAPPAVPLEPPPARQEVPEPAVADQPVPGPAVVALLDAADQYSASGQREQAAASLERALRIEPGNPVLWHRLGRLRLQERQWDQAIALAEKSNALARGDKALQAGNWEVIAAAREAIGDATGALQARKRAQGLRE